MFDTIHDESVSGLSEVIIEGVEGENVVLISMIGVSHNNVSNRYLMLQTSNDGGATRSSVIVSGQCAYNNPISGLVKIVKADGVGFLEADLQEPPANGIAARLYPVSSQFAYEPDINWMRLAWSAGKFDAGTVRVRVA